jgi:hypothetical protein
MDEMTRALRYRATNRFEVGAQLAAARLYGTCRGARASGVWRPAMNGQRLTNMSAAMKLLSSRLEHEMAPEERQLAGVVGSGAGLIRNGDPVTNMRRNAALAFTELNEQVPGAPPLFEAPDQQLLEEGMLATLALPDANGRLIQPVGVEQVMGSGGGEFELMQKIAADASQAHLVDSTSLQHGIGEYLERLEASGVGLPMFRDFLGDVKIDVDHFSVFVDERIGDVEQHRFLLPETEAHFDGQREVVTRDWRRLRDQVQGAVEHGVPAGAALRRAAEAAEAYTITGELPDSLDAIELSGDMGGVAPDGAMEHVVQRLCGRATEGAADGPVQDSQSRLAPSDVLAQLEREFEQPGALPDLGEPGPDHPPQGPDDPGGSGPPAFEL